VFTRGHPLPSEGRGREFESRRARHEIKDLGEAKDPSVPVVSQFERAAVRMRD
jgi:hypothetical protein